MGESEYEAFASTQPKESGTLTLQVMDQLQKVVEDLSLATQKDVGHSQFQHVEFVEPNPIIYASLLDDVVKEFGTTQFMSP